MHSTEECEGAQVSAEKETDLNCIMKDVQSNREIQLGANQNESEHTAEQELVISRDERKRKPSDEENKAPKKPKTVTGKENESVNSAAASLSTINLSVAQKNKADTAEEEEMESSLKMAVVPVGYPENKMTEEQAEVLKTCVIEKINPADPGEPIQFSAIQYKNGAVIFTCDNKSTKVWLYETIPTLTPWPDVKLEIGRAEYKLQGRELVLYQRKLMQKRRNKQVLELLEKQNKGISTAKWRVVSNEGRDDKEDKRKRIVVWVDDESYETMKEHGFKFFLGLGQVHLKLLSEMETPIKIPISQQPPKPVPASQQPPKPMPAVKRPPQPPRDIYNSIPKRPRDFSLPIRNLLPGTNCLGPCFLAVNQLQPHNVRLPNPSENRLAFQNEAQSHEHRFKAPNVPHPRAGSVPSHIPEARYANSDPLSSRESTLLDSDIWERRYSMVDGQTHNIRQREVTNAPQPHVGRYPDQSLHVSRSTAPWETHFRESRYESLSRDTQYPVQVQHLSHDMHYSTQHQNMPLDSRYPELNKYQSRDMQYRAPDQRLSRDTWYPSLGNRESDESRVNIPGAFRSQEPRFMDSGFPLARESRSGPSYISSSREFRNTFSNSSRVHEDRSSGSNLFRRREQSPSYTSFSQSRGSRSTDWNRPTDSRYSRP